MNDNFFICSKIYIFNVTNTIVLNNKTPHFWSDKPVDDPVCSLSPLSGALAGAAAPLVGIDGWAHIEHIKRPWLLSAHIGISAIHIRNPNQMFSKKLR